jgi:cytochrome oxidase Cu insertion factor (SCO1/SenC/PrrC family)
MHQTPPNIPANVYQAFVTDRMIRTPLRFLRGILAYKNDPDVRMDDFEDVLEVGEVAPDFALETLSGERFSLTDHRGEWVLLEFGSYTCPMYRRQISGMARLAREYEGREDVTFALVYGKEAHPHQGAFLAVDDPETYEERRALASRLVTEVDVPFPVLVDEVPRKVSAEYGGAPNMVYLVDPEGRIAYRALWTDAEELERVLREAVGAPTVPY